MAKKKRSGWGGARPGAGRKPKGERAGVPHLKRPKLIPGRPILVTVRVRPDVWKLNTRRCLPVVEQAFSAGGEKFGFHVLQYGVQEDHIHLLVDAANQKALGRGMKGLGVRLSRQLNKLMVREGTGIGEDGPVGSYAGADTSPPVLRQSSTLYSRRCVPQRRKYKACGTARGGRALRLGRSGLPGEAGGEEAGTVFAAPLDTADKLDFGTYRSLGRDTGDTARYGEIRRDTDGRRPLLCPPVIAAFIRIHFSARLQRVKSPHAFFRSFGRRR